MIIGIGINQYKDKENIPSLSWAKEDATALHGVFDDPDYWGIPSQNVTLLVDEKATRENILRSIKRIQREVQKDDTVFIHFSGHGCSEHDEVQGYQDDQLSKYLVPYDTDVDNLIASAIDFKFFTAQLDRIKSEKPSISLKMSTTFLLFSVSSYHSLFKGNLSKRYSINPEAARSWSLFRDHVP